MFEIVLSSGDNKANELPSGEIPLISAGENNNGVTKYIKHGDGKAQIFPANIITADMFGNFFYQPREFYAVSHGRVNMLIPKNNYFTQFNRFIGTFLCAFSFKFRAIFGFSNMLSKTKIEKETLILPTINGTIAFEFMENYIKELETERIKELEAYLQVTGLKDYKLNTQEREALAIFASSLRESTQKHPHCHTERSEVSQKNSDRDISAFAKPQYDNYSLHWREFKIGELFSVKSNPQLNKDSFEFAENGEYPYFTRTCLNNGINGYVNYLDEEHKIKGNGLAVGMLGMQFFICKKIFMQGNLQKLVIQNLKDLIKK